MTGSADRPSILIDGDDTVVTLLADADAGDVVYVPREGDEDDVRFDGDRLAATEAVPFGHTVALVAHDRGDEVRKYGATVGVATEPIAPGEWVHTHNCESVRGRNEGGTDLAETSPDTDRSESASYSGHDDRVGARDVVLVLPSVVCSSVVAERIADAVEGCVVAPHDHGCGQIGRDNDRTKRTLVGIGTNPNVAGVVVVGLGCEHVQSDEVAATLAERGVPVRELTIQGAGGTDACRERGADLARELRKSTPQSGAADLGDLTVGIVSTGLDEPTVETADPLVGRFADRVRDAGGRVVVAGRERVLAHPEAAAERVDADLESIRSGARSDPPRAPRVRRSVAERSFEATTRAWGSGPVEEVVAYGDGPAPGTDLALVDSSSRFEEAATALVAAGAGVVIHVTGEGIPTGHPIAPVVKVSATPATLEAVGPDVDVDARETDPADLAATVRAIVRGEPCRAEAHGVHTVAIERAGPSM